MMSEVVAFPDAESVAIAFLHAELTERDDPAHVSTRIPHKRPSRFVQVTLTGGNRRNLVQDESMLTFRCWDETSVKAAELCRLIRALVFSMPGRDNLGAWVYAVTEIGGPQSYPDPDTPLPRYQFTAQLRLASEPL